MEKKLKIWDRADKWWQLHNKWVFVALILVFVIIGWLADRSTNSYRYLGTASVVLSIVLSLVVIGYTLAQNVIAHINSDKMGRLIEKLDQRIDLVRQDVRGIKDKILNEPYTQVSPKKDLETISEEAIQVGKDEVFFSLLATSNISRLFAHFLLKSHSANKFLRVQQFVTIVDPLVKMSTAELESHVYGILHGMSCCLKEFLAIENQTSVRLLKLPGNFEQHLKIVALWMKKRNARLAECLSQIDNIV